MLDNKKDIERAIIVGVILPTDRIEDVNESLDELELLVDTAGGKVVERVFQNRTKIDPAYYIGEGKVEQIKNLASTLNVDTIIFDTELSPSQVKNLEKVSKKKILDRTGVILDIFAKRARTNEAKTQVELAQLEYFLPRLSRHWTHLSRQYGGIGTKGPGETQLEVDRRMIRDRIKHLKEKLKKIDKSKQVMRKERESQFKVVLVGYTNAGKSTLLNSLSGSNVFVEDRLFATLDATARQVYLSKENKIILIDTVGFIKKLPHHLVTSFKSTLDEVRFADIILHVIDITHPKLEDNITIVNKILKELEVDKPIVYVFNKIDKLEPKLRETLISRFSEIYTPSVFIAAKNSFNLDILKETISLFFNEELVEKVIEVPLKDYKIVSYIYSVGSVLEEKFLDDKIRIKVRLKKYLLNKILSLLSTLPCHS